MTGNLVSIDMNMVFQLVNTLVLFLLLRHFLFRPVSNFMEARRNKIKSSLQLAEEKNREADKLREEYEGKLANIKEEAQKIIREAAAKGEERRQEIIREARREADRILERARREIQLEKEKALEEVKAHVVDMAIMAAEKVIEKNLDTNTNRAIVRDFIEKVGKVS